MILFSTLYVQVLCHLRPPLQTITTTTTALHSPLNLVTWWNQRNCISQHAERRPRWLNIPKSTTRVLGQTTQMLLRILRNTSSHTSSIQGLVLDSNQTTAFAWATSTWFSETWILTYPAMLWKSPPTLNTTHPKPPHLLPLITHPP